MSRYMNIGVTPQQLLKAMKGESEARLYYEKLMQLAPNQEQAEIIRLFFEDELKHFENFKLIYTRITGRKPILPPLMAPIFATYIEGIEHAIIDELNAYGFYRDIYLSVKDAGVRDIFFEALTDENEHAAHLNYLFTKNKCECVQYMPQMQQLPISQAGYTLPNECPFGVPMPNFIQNENYLL